MLLTNVSFLLLLIFYALYSQINCLFHMKNYNNYYYKSIGKDIINAIHKFIFYIIHLYTKYYRNNNTIQEIANAND